ncbi:hypothetical protein COU54_04030 [Candidatus Pacearchaeota archaeon CG10_big_fil_rev_8_21_14_0_10_31_24]|nr:MAG: hypothetical protein COU54_04030 [Candidatus Pacearchaeota archaeon CG10_big_fil_rev_8_21_14_0_10_31_24]
MFIDIHCHLDILENLELVIKNARKNKLGIILAQGVDVRTNRKVLELDSKYMEVKSALGLYPMDALKLSDEEIDEEIDFIRKCKNVNAIGEVGIDFKESEDLKEKERQKNIFRKFVLLSMELNIPIIVHSRKAEEECISILEELKAKKVIMHCFCGNKKLVSRIKDNNWYITIPTSVTRSQQFQEIALEFPLDRLFCETDAPFLHPFKSFNESKNEPSWVVESYKKIAELRKMSLKDIESRIEKNYRELF